MNLEVENIQKENLNFFKLFYDTLFFPNKAAEEIKSLAISDPTSLFWSSIIILLLSCLANASKSGDLSKTIPNLLIWLFSLCFFGFLFWLFQAKDNKVNYLLLFSFCSFAQAPLLLLGISDLWANSIIKFSGLTAIISLWSLCLWVWAIAHALELKLSKAIILSVLVLCGPVILVAYVLISIALYFVISLG